MEEEAGGGGGPSIGRVLRLAFDTIAAQPFLTLGLAFLVAALPSRVLDYGMRWAEPLIQGRLSTGGRVSAYVAVALVAIALSSMGQAALVAPVWSQAMNRRAGFWESLRAMLGVLPTVVAVSFIFDAVAALGFAALVVPGIIAICAWAVAVPVLVAEQCGPIEALRRSAYLTRHARWKVFALLVIYLAAASLIGLVSKRLQLLVPETWANWRQARFGIDVPLVPYLITSLVQMVTEAMFGSMWNALYIELRDWKDGLPRDALAEVFA
jgi:hypothetical protein